MKKILLLLIATTLSLATLAQTSGDKLTISTSEGGKTATWPLAGAGNVVSSLKHTTDGKLEIYVKGQESSGAFETYDVDKIAGITFSVQHEGNEPISAKEAVADMGLGFNLGNTLDSNGAWIKKWTAGAPSNYETAWGQPVTTKAMIDFLKAGGFGAVRVPVTWYQHIDSNGNITDTAWLNRVQEVVDYVIDNGMYCILNVHHDTGADSDDFTSWIKADAANYATNKAKFETLWTQIATRFRDYNPHLLFEGYNEMLDASSTWNAPRSTASYAALNNYAQSFVNAVRATGGKNSHRNLIITTYAAACGDAVVNNLTLPTDEVSGHLAVEVHTYAPWDWFAQKGKWDSSCTQEIASMFTRLNNKFIRQGIPVIIGEYGTHGNATVSKTSTATQIQAAADQAADIVRQAKKYGAATFYWMSIFDGTDRSVPQWTLPTVVEAMVKAQAE